jgi:hypothetical protein
MLLRGSQSYVSPYWLFIFLFIVSRFLSIAGFVACAQFIGIADRTQQIFFAILVSTTFLLRGLSFAGGGGLFINNFTHSEIANGLFLIALYLALHKQIISAIALLGVIFFVNAFFGIWAGIVLGVLFLAQVARGDLHWAEASRRAAIGAGVATLFAAPILLSVLSNPELGKPLAFDYVSYLKEYFPGHFLFAPIGIREKIGLLLVTAAGAGALIQLGPRSRLVLIAFAAACAVYALGIVASYTTHAQSIFNLHLLRISTLIQLLSALAACALATKWWFDENPVKRAFAAPSLILLLAAPVDDAPSPARILAALGVLLAILAVTPPLSRFLRRIAPSSITTWQSKLRIAAAVGLVCVIPVAILQHQIKNRRQQAWIDEWRRIGEWARASTPLDATFMVPVVNWNFPKNYSGEQLDASDNAIFESTAHRKIWVDFKRGAAVMWSPSYYGIWRRRVDEESSLSTWQDKDSYAREKGISYIAELCGREEPRENATFATERLCVYPVAAQATR